MKKPIISVIIPTVSPDNYKLLTKCITSFANNKSDKFDFELVVIPNNWEGFEKPTNRGLKLCTGDYILFTNDDVWVKKTGWEEVMVEEFKDGVGMVSGTGYQWNDLPSFWFVMISREVLEKVGLLDEEFLLYSSDHDYGYRVKMAGFKIVHLQLNEFIGHVYCSTSKRFPNEGKLLKDMKLHFEKKWGFQNTHKGETQYINLNDISEEKEYGTKVFSMG